MHDFILALSFVAMVITPAVVAAISGKEKKGAKATATAKIAAARPVLVPQQSRKVVAWEAPTLPLHQTLGLAGR
jgi:hypothetical protein